MIDFVRHARRVRAAKAVRCPACSAEPGKACVALGGTLDGWKVTFDRGERVLLIHAARYPSEAAS